MGDHCNKGAGDAKFGCEGFWSLALKRTCSYGENLRVGQFCYRAFFSCFDSSARNRMLNIFRRSNPFQIFDCIIKPVAIFVINLFFFPIIRKESTRYNAMDVSLHRDAVYSKGNFGVPAGGHLRGDPSDVSVFFRKNVPFICYKISAASSRYFLKYHSMNLGVGSSEQQALN